MAIVNRTLDASEQRKSFTANFAATATGLTLPILEVPFNSTLDAVQLAAFGLSGAPTYALRVQRFIVGTGLTVIAGGATTATPPEFGTSGILTMSLATSGSTLLNLLAGDVLTITTGAADTAVKSLSVGICIKAVQDIKTTNGV